MEMAEEDLGNMSTPDRIDALNRTLADATVECPRMPFDDHGWITCIHDCDRGRIVRFPGFRQECSCADSEFEDIPLGQVCKCELAGAPDGSIGETNQRGACFGCRLGGYHDSTCHHVLQLHERCNGTGWQVRAGGLEDGLAGLVGEQGDRFLERLGEELERMVAYKYPEPSDTDPMPSAPEILAEGLRLVIEIAGLEVPDA